MCRRTMNTIIVLAIAVFSILSLISSTEAAGIGDALVLCLSFDEGIGGVAKDSSQMSFNGTVSGAEWAPGKFGKALKFDEMMTLCLFRILAHSAS